MIAFIIKSGICLFLLFGLYWLILRKEKLLIFNRYYLIFSALFSLAVPFISIPVDFGPKKVAGQIVTALSNKPGLNSAENSKVTLHQAASLSRAAENNPGIETAPDNSNPVDWKAIGIIVYILGLIPMSIRFCRNILVTHRMFRRSETIDHEWYKIALHDTPANPFSFHRTIFLNRQDYLENRIAANVFRHELEHVRQLHSCDVIYFEILHIIFWFNPVLILYKRAARINHEYLADEAVIRDSSDIEAYAGELINFISRRASVPFTSGFNPSMIRKRLLMLNTDATSPGKNFRMGITLFSSAILTSFISIKSVPPDPQGGADRKQAGENDDIVIEEVYFRDPGFKPLKALVVIDGKTLGINDTLSVNPQQIKTIDVLKGRKAIRKFGRLAKNGAVELNTYESDKGSIPDSIYFKPIYTLNNKIPEGTITIPVSNMYSLSMWTYPIFPKQDLRKRWRTIDFATRDYYRIKGTVIQDNGEPLPGAKVTATDNPSEALTDKNGRFLLKDVRQDAVVGLSANGYKPLFFKAKGAVFTTDLTLTPDKKDEPVQNIKWTNFNLKDFSGRWEYDKELSGARFDIIKYVYDIRQYDSDSIEMNISRAYENYRELDSKVSFVFNSVRTESSSMFDNIKLTLTCSIGADGQFFSVTYDVKSKLGLFNEDKRTDIYTLSDDGKHLILRTVDFPDGSDTSGKEIGKMAFDKK